MPPAITRATRRTNDSVTYSHMRSVCVVRSSKLAVSGRAFEGVTSRRGGGLDGGVDIQTYKRAHAADMRHKSKAEIAAKKPA